MRAELWVENGKEAIINAFNSQDTQRVLGRRYGKTSSNFKN